MGLFSNDMEVRDDAGNALPISASSLPLPTGASTSASQTTGNSSLSSIDGKITAVNTGAVVVSSSALPAGAATAAKQPALGTAGTASADVITVQGKASMTPVLIDGSGVTQPVSLATNTPTLQSGSTTAVTQATGTNLHAVIDTGSTTAVTQGTATNLKAQAEVYQGGVAVGAAAPLQVSLANAPTVGISGSVTQGPAASVSAGWPVIGGELADTTGTFSNATQTTSVTSTSFDGYSSVIVSINGTYGTATGVFEISDDSGTTWYSVNAARTDGTSIETGYTSLTNTNRMWTLSVSGADQFRVRSTAVASGTVNVRISVESMPTPEAASVTAYQPTAANLNATVNNAQVAGTTIDVNSGTKSAGTMRVVLATDQPQLTNKLLVTPDSVALPANQSTNVSQINAVTPLMGNGVTGTGSQRVTIASDNTAFTVNAAQATAGNLNATVVGNGTFAVQTTSDVPGTGATNLGKAEDAAAVSGDTGVMVLGVRNDSLTAAQTNANGDYGAMSLDTSGIVITAGAPRALKGRQVTTITSSTAETTIATAVASTFLDIYGLILTNTSATVTKVSVRDATAGGTISVFEVPATESRGLMLPLDSAIPQATVNNNWTAQCGTSVASLEVTVLYVKRV